MAQNSLLGDVKDFAVLGLLAVGGYFLYQAFKPKDAAVTLSGYNAGATAAASTIEDKNTQSQLDKAAWDILGYPKKYVFPDGTIRSIYNPSAEANALSSGAYLKNQAQTSQSPAAPPVTTSISKTSAAATTPTSGLTIGGFSIGSPQAAAAATSARGAAVSSTTSAYGAGTQTIFRDASGKAVKVVYS